MERTSCSGGEDVKVRVGLVGLDMKVVMERGRQLPSAAEQLMSKGFQLDQCVTLMHSWKCLTENHTFALTSVMQAHKQRQNLHPGKGQVKAILQ